MSRARRHGRWPRWKRSTASWWWSCTSWSCWGWSWSKAWWGPAVDWARRPSMKAGRSHRRWPRCWTRSNRSRRTRSRYTCRWPSRLTRWGWRSAWSRRILEGWRCSSSAADSFWHRFANQVWVGMGCSSLVSISSIRISAYYQDSPCTSLGKFHVVSFVSECT